MTQRNNLGGNVAGVMIGVLAVGKLVYVETNHYTIGEAAASIRIVHDINDATHRVTASHYDDVTDKTVFDFERVRS